MAATTIAATSRAWNKSSTSNWWVAKCCFVVGTAMYVVTQDTGASPKLRIHKSTSLSSLSFSEQDAANNISVTSATQAFSAWATSTHIHVVYFSAANAITHRRFVISSDTWTTGHGNATTDGWNQDSIRVVVRSDSDVLVFFNSHADSADMKYSRWEGSSWTETTLVSITDGGASAVVDAEMDSNDFAHVFYYDANADDFSWISISSTNTASSVVDIDSTAIGSDASRIGGNFDIYSVSGNQTITAAFADSDSTLDEGAITLGAAAAGGSVATLASIEATTSTIGANTIVTTSSFGGIPYAVWWDDASSGTFYYSTKSGGSWAARSSWKTQSGGGITSSTNMTVQAIFVTGVGLMVVYQDGTDLKIDTLAAIVSPTGTVSIGEAVGAGLSVSGRVGYTGAVSVGQADGSGLSVSASYIAHFTGTVTIGQAVGSGLTVTGTPGISVTGIVSIGEAIGSGLSVTGIGEIPGELGTVLIGEAIGSGLSVTGRSGALGSVSIGQAAASGLTASGLVSYIAVVDIGQAAASGLTVLGRASALGAVAIGQAAASGLSIAGSATAVGSVTLGEAVGTGLIVVAGLGYEGVVSIGQAAASGLSVSGSIAAIGVVSVGTAIGDGGAALSPRLFFLAFPLHCFPTVEMVLGAHPMASAGTRTISPMTLNMRATPTVVIPLTAVEAA